MTHRSPTPANKKKLLLVLGMHRSGTSALTRGMQVVGAEFGGRFLDAQKDNPKGFWEDADLRNLHLEMFEALGMAWNRLTPLSPEEIRRLETLGYHKKAKQLLHSKMTKGEIHAFKHPRMAKLFPFWREVFETSEYDVLCVLAVRHPLSVAKSLATRDQIEKTYACLMWLSHVIPSLFVPEPSRAIVSDYDRLISDPSLEMKRIANRFGSSVDSDEMEEYKNDFLEADLRHSSHSLKDLEQDPELPGLVMEVYSGLLDLATDKIRMDDPESQIMFRQWAAKFDRSAPFLRLIETTTAERDHQAILLNSARNDLAWRDASLSWKLTEPLRQACTLKRKVFGPGRDSQKQ